MIQLASLVLPVQAGEWLQPNEEVVQDSGIGVNSTVQEANLAVAGINLTQPRL